MWAEVGRIGWGTEFFLLTNPIRSAQQRLTASNDLDRQEIAYRLT